MTRRVAFFIGPTLAGTKNGIVSQALTWKKGLKERGVAVDLISPWQQYDWESYDVIHIFGLGHHLDIVHGLKLRGARRLVVSPIFDVIRPNMLANFASRLNFGQGFLKTIPATFRSVAPYVDIVIARSDFESINLMTSFGIPSAKIEICMLPVRFDFDPDGFSAIDRSVCSHVSILSAPIKNVRRLVEAAIKYKFSLVLAGSIPDSSFGAWVDQIISSHDHIDYVGTLSDEELRLLYLRSKVFALPSLAEGVGLVGLEAALHGADIVLTDRGGPKEYYAGMASLVDPNSIDEIGCAVLDFMNGRTNQPELSNYISREHSIAASVSKLIEIYEKRA